jgi:hypothetical protein
MMFHKIVGIWEHPEGALMGKKELHPALRRTRAGVKPAPTSEILYID